MNLVLITLDSLRSDYVGFNGNTWVKTQNLDKFAGEGVYFKHAYPEALPTIPVRRTLHTGRRCFPNRDWNINSKPQTPGWIPIPDGQLSLAEVLFAKGYQTALATDVFHTFRPGMNFHKGFEEWHWVRGQECDRFHTGSTVMDFNHDKHYTSRMNRESRKYTDLKMYLKNSAFRESEEDYYCAQVFRSGARWLEQNYDTDKWFLCLDCFDPHEPWDPPQYYRDMYNPGYKGTEIYCPDYVTDYREVMTAEELQHVKALYAGEVTMVDYWLGYFLNKLEHLGLADHTAVVICSDHGFQLGDNNYLGKYPTGLFDCLMNLFMAIRWPGCKNNGHVVDGLVSNMDLYPTIFQMLGMDAPEWAEGRSLIPAMNGDSNNTREYVTSMYKNHGWIRNQDYTFFCRLDYTDLNLYGNHSDPEQSNNLAGQKPEICKRMWDLLQQDGGGKVPFFNVVSRSNALHP